MTYSESLTPSDYLQKSRSDVQLKILKDSLDLDTEVQIRTILDPDGLRHDFRLGLIKMLVVNSDECSIYRTPNVGGNKMCAYGLNKSNGQLIISNSDNANFTARNRLVNLIKANPEFCYFFTGTFDPKKWNRKDFKKLHASLTRWLRRRGIKYILIPEPHKDGSIHFHGFFDDSIEPFLTEFDRSKKLPKRITDALDDGRTVLNCPAYADMFGWVSIEKIRNLEACAVYAAKYVSKCFDEDGTRFSYHRYFTSLHLKRPFETFPTAERLEGHEPTRYSSQIPKVYYKNRHGVRQEPDGFANTLSGVLKTPFLPAVREAHDLNEGGTVEPYPLK